MPIDTYAELRRRLRSCDGQIVDITKSFTSPAGGQLSSGWTSAGTHVGSAPSTATACDRTTAGALGQRNKAAGATRRYCMVRSIVSSRGDGTGSSPVLLVDRLSHQGGLSGNDGSSQTTNLPTAALTRNTNGVDVWAAAEIYTSIGTGGGTLSGVYTNSAGAGSRGFVATPFGVTSWNAAQKIIPLLMAAGDRGVRSVESMQLSGGSGTVGNWGVTLFKTLGTIHMNLNKGIAQLGDPIADLGPIFEVPTDACIQLLSIGPGQATTSIHGELFFFDVVEP